MRAFFQTLVNSVISFEFYSRLINKPFGDSVRFYVLFLIFATILHVLPLYFSTYPQLQHTFQSVLEEWKNNHSEDLVFKWNGERLTSTADEITVSYPSILQSYARDAELPQNLGYISTNPETTLPRLDALFTITSTDILIPATGGEVAQAALREVVGSEPITITKDTPEQIKNWWTQHASKVFLTVAIMTPFAVYVALFFQRLFQVCIEGLFFYFFKKVVGHTWSYLTSVKYALHLFVPAEIVGLIAHYAYPNAPISFFSLTVWVYFLSLLFFPATYIVLKKQSKD